MDRTTTIMERSCGQHFEKQAKSIIFAERLSNIDLCVDKCAKI